MKDDAWMRVWQPMIDAIGTDFGADYHRQGADAVEVGAIRRFLEPLEFDCPLHYDRSVAQALGYRDIIAPYSTLLSWIIPPLWEPGLSVWEAAGRDLQPSGSMRLPWQASHIPQPETSRAFATHLEVEYIEPITVGDHLAISGAKLLACKPKQTKVGQGAFLTWQSDIRSQSGKVIAKVCYGRYCYDPVAEMGEDPGFAPLPVEGPEASSEGLTKARQGQGARPLAQGSREPVWRQPQRHWEDVVEGEVLAETAFPLTLHRLVVAAGANRDFNGIHHNSNVACASGAKEAYANNVFLQGMWERSVRGYIGNAGTIARWGPFAMSSFNYVGDSVVTRGLVRRKWQEGGRHWVELEMRCENGRGISVAPGPVVVTLPTREPPSAGAALAS